ncbi:MAG: GNAT family N-acetyltransferase [Pseudomonadota bacterium]
MDLSKYHLERAGPGADWDALVEASDQGTIFALSAYLEAIPFRPAYWLCMKGDQVAGAAALIETADGTSTQLAPHVIHGGLMFAPAPPEQVAAMTISEEYRITCAMLRDLAATYRDLAFQGAPTLTDLRPLQWHNYGQDGPKVRIDLRYTSYVPLVPMTGDLPEWPVYLALNKSRRQSVRYGMKAGITVDQDATIADFLGLYRETFARQDVTVPEEEIALLDAVCTALRAQGRLRLFAARPVDGTLGSISVWGLDAKRAYYLYGANAPALREEHCGTMAIFDAFRALAAEGVEEVDMEGINSPQRGYFKLSFGGDVRPYPRVHLAQ